MTDSWHLDHTAALVRCVDAGMSSGQTAAELSAMNGHAVTRNAVIGKAKRMKLQWHGHHGNWQKGTKRPPRPRSSPPARSTPFRAPNPPADTDSPRPIPAAPNSQPVDLLGLNNWNCHWPLWADDHAGSAETKLYCGAPECDVNGGLSYCALHARMAVNRRGGE